MHPQFYTTAPTVPNNPWADNCNDLLSGVILVNALRSAGEMSPSSIHTKPLALIRWRAVKLLQSLAPPVAPSGPDIILFIFFPDPRIALIYELSIAIDVRIT
jgi:hypothetical protein